MWVNCGDRIHSHINDTRALSDHNVIGVNLSTNEIKQGGQNVLKIKWKNFNETRYLEKLRNIDWNNLYNEKNVDVANSILQEELEKIIESEAPMGITQIRTKYSNWLEDTTKAIMIERDITRDLARVTGQLNDWNKYKKNSEMRRLECRKKIKLNTKKSNLKEWKMRMTLLNSIA